MSSLRLQVSITYNPQEAPVTSTLLVGGGGGGCHTVPVQQRGVLLQLSDLRPEVFNSLLQLLDDIDVLFLQFCCLQDTFLLQIGEIIT